MLSLLIFLIILILKAEARPSDNDLQSHQNLTDHAMIESILKSRKDNYSHNDFRVNGFGDQPYNDPSDPLLVGFAGDPFRYSVTEEDYMKGIRNIDLQVYKNKTGNRGKRNIFQLYNMVKCATGCDPLSYNGYGCYCGLGGSGITVDAIDGCCQAHDECYGNLDSPWNEVYLQPYLWKCHYGGPRCPYENFDPKYSFLLDTADRVCECDRKFAMCLSRYRCPSSKPRCLSLRERQRQNKIRLFIMDAKSPSKRWQAEVEDKLEAFMRESSKEPAQRKWKAMDEGFAKLWNDVDF